MNYELLVGLKVKDPQIYQQYREAMRPLLESYGGGFRYDFEVNKVLKGDDAEINRVFVIYFRSKAAMDEFFSHPDYLEIKKKFFSVSVAKTTIISEYSLNP